MSEKKNDKQKEKPMTKPDVVKERLPKICDAYIEKGGTPQTYIDREADLEQDEKAELFDQAVRSVKGREPKVNPYKE